MISFVTKPGADLCSFVHSDGPVSMKLKKSMICKGLGVKNSLGIMIPSVVNSLTPAEAESGYGMGFPKTFKE